MKSEGGERERERRADSGGEVGGGRSGVQEQRQKLISLCSYSEETLPPVQKQQRQG
jgi:hypothetical protein